MKKTTLQRSAIVALMSVFTLGFCFIILGSISSELMSALGIDGGKFGTLVLALFLTSCIVQLFIGPLVDKVGYKPIAILGFAVTSVSMLILAFAQSFYPALFACVLMGVGAMALNTVGNTLMPVVLYDGKDPARAANFGNAFFGLGYVVTPLLIVFILRVLKLNYDSALIIISLISLVFLVFAITTSYPKVATGFKFSNVFMVMLKPAVIVAAIALFCYISLEVSMGTWIRKLMEELYGQNLDLNAATKSGIVLSLFGVAMMVGRFITSAFKNLTAMGPKLIIIMSLIALISISLMVVAKSPAVGIIAVILAGMSLAPIFPTIIGVTFSKFEPGLYGSIFGFLFSFGLLGGTFVPKLIGNLSVGSTVQASLLIPGIMAAILLVVSIFIGRVGNSGTAK